MRRMVPAVLVVVLSLFPALSAAGDSPSYKILLPTGEAHELLPKTCTVCHKGDDWQFFVVAARGQEGLEKALTALKAPGSTLAVPHVEKPKNAHASTACPFCHIDPAHPGDDPTTLSFRSVDGTSVRADGVVHLCEMCHPGAQKDHPRVLGRAGAAEELAAAGLPVRGG